MLHVIGCISGSVWLEVSGGVLTRDDILPVNMIISIFIGGTILGLLSLYFHDYNTVEYIMS
jgi:hypothetical protein